MIDRCPPASHLRIAVPAYTGFVTADTSHSLNEATLLLREAGVIVSFDYLCGCCYLDNARNMLATRFMESNATDMLFVDADLGFAPEAALMIAKQARPFVAGIYRKKTDNPEWPVTFEKDELWSDADGLIEATTVPTGFMRLNRAVFEEMPSVPYRDQEGIEYQAWFNCGARNGLYWGEDTRFCIDWRSRGGKIHILPDLIFAHNGLKAFTGSWGSWMREHNKENTQC